MIWYEKLEGRKLAPDKKADLQELRNRCNPQMLCSSYKEAIFAASELTTQTRRAERRIGNSSADRRIRASREPKETTHQRGKKNAGRY